MLEKINPKIEKNIHQVSFHGSKKFMAVIFIFSVYRDEESIENDERVEENVEE